MNRNERLAVLAAEGIRLRHGDDYDRNQFRQGQVRGISQAMTIEMLGVGPYSNTTVFNNAWDWIEQWLAKQDDQGFLRLPGAHIQELIVAFRRRKEQRVR